MPLTNEVHGRHYTGSQARRPGQGWLGRAARATSALRIGRGRFCKPLNLVLLGRLPELEALHDLSALRLARNLRRIELEWLPHVETLPDLSEFARLEEVEMGT